MGKVANLFFFFYTCFVARFFPSHFFLPNDVDVMLHRFCWNRMSPCSIAYSKCVPIQSWCHNQRWPMMRMVLDCPCWRVCVVLRHNFSNKQESHNNSNNNSNNHKLVGWSVPTDCAPSCSRWRPPTHHQHQRRQPPCWWRGPWNGSRRRFEFS